MVTLRHLKLDNDRYKIIVFSIFSILFLRLLTTDLCLSVIVTELVGWFLYMPAINIENKKIKIINIIVQHCVPVLFLCFYLFFNQPNIIILMLGIIIDGVLYGTLKTTKYVQNWVLSAIVPIYLFVFSKIMTGNVLDVFKILFIQRGENDINLVLMHYYTILELLSTWLIFNVLNIIVKGRKKIYVFISGLTYVVTLIGVYTLYTMKTSFNLAYIKELSSFFSKNSIMDFVTHNMIFVVEFFAVILIASILLKKLFKQDEILPKKVRRIRCVASIILLIITSLISQTILLSLSPEASAEVGGLLEGAISSIPSEKNPIIINFLNLILAAI